MKNTNKTNKIIRIVAVVLATSGFFSLAVDGIVKLFWITIPKLNLLLSLLVFYQHIIHS